MVAAATSSGRAIVEAISGLPLTDADLNELAKSVISPKLAEAAYLCRVNDQAGRQLVGVNGYKSDFSGIVFPYIMPGENTAVTHRLRRDYPDLKTNVFTGKPEVDRKYIGPPERGNYPYFPPGIQPEWLQDTSVPIIVTEGEKKALALWEVASECSNDSSETPAFIPIGFPGVWGWRGTLERRPSTDGKFVSVKGPIVQLRDILWPGRDVFLWYDADVRTKDQVRAARDRFAEQLDAWGAVCRYIDIPSEAGVKGVDDLVHAWGRGRVFDYIRQGSYLSPYAEKNESVTREEATTIDVRELPSVFTINSAKLDFVVPGLIATQMLHLITGTPGCGKSTFISALGAAVASGGDFLGKKCERREVLLIDRENGCSIVSERFERLGITDGNGFHVWGGWNQPSPPGLDDPAIHSFVTSCPGSIILIDSLIAFLDGDENNAADMRRFVAPLRRFAHLGAAVIVLHHTGKGETSSEYRGSSDIKASFDIGLRLVNTGGSLLSSMDLIAFKERFLVEAPLSIRVSDGQFYADRSRRPIQPNPADRLRDFSLNNQGILKTDFGRKAIAELPGITRKMVESFLADGLGKTISIRKGGRNNAQHLWFHEEGENPFLSQ